MNDEMKRKIKEFNRFSFDLNFFNIFHLFSVPFHFTSCFFSCSLFFFHFFLFNIINFKVILCTYIFLKIIIKRMGTGFPFFQVLSSFFFFFRFSFDFFPFYVAWYCFSFSSTTDFSILKFNNRIHHLFSFILYVFIPIIKI